MPATEQTFCVIGLTLAVAALLGCAGPRPESPAAAAITVPAQWLANHSNDEPGAADEWVRGFGDPMLARLIEAALANNIDISVAAARVEEARAQYDLSRAQRGLYVAGGVAGVRERTINPAFGIPQEQTAGQAALSASYDLDLFERLSNASAAARAALLATEASKETVRIAVLTGVTEGYVTLRALDERLRILNQTLAAREEEVRFTRRRASVGYSPVIDLKQAEAAYRAAEQAIPAVTLLIARQEHALSILLGDNPRTIERGLELTDIHLPPRSSVLPSQLLARRPDILQAEQQIVAADRSLDAARAAFMPSIQLQASGGWVESTLLKDDPIGIFSLGGSVLAPIFDSGRLHAQQNLAAARRDQAAFAYRKTVLTAFREVEDALTAIEQNERQLRAVESQRDEIARILELAQKRYRAGYSPYIEQLDAQRNLLTAELAAVQARADLLISSVALYRSVGAGWRVP
ncbi:efflux transporter outer membrane subunit [Steroidobacter flavus]|uniref:Efflux transporter outer membrane subunit n=1 Tax=Steroidobacter flavus TaxID=1842136 RepID=A0ABV8T2A0_9GAMM